MWCNASKFRTVSHVLSLPALVQFEHVEEHLAGQAALAAAAIRRKQRRRRLKRGQTPAGGSHRVQRRSRVPPTPRLAAAVHRQMTATVEKTDTDITAIHSVVLMRLFHRLVVVVTWASFAAGSRWCRGRSGSDSSGPPAEALQKPGGTRVKSYMSSSVFHL